VADWTPPTSDAVAVADFVPPASDRVVAPSNKSLPVVRTDDDLARLVPGSDYIDSSGAKKTFTPEDSEAFSKRYFKGPTAGMFAGLPASGKIPGSRAVKSILLQSGFGTAGAIAGTALPGPGNLIGGAAGAALGNILDQETDPEYDANKPGLGIKKGQVLAAGASNLVPVAGLTGNVAGTIAKNVVRQGLGGLAAKTIETGIDENRLPTKKEAIMAATIPAVTSGLVTGAQYLNPEVQAAIQEAEKSTAGKQAVLDKAMDEGFLVQPSSVNKTKVGNAIEGIGGTTDIKRDVQANNIEQFNRLAKRAAGLNPDEALNEVNLEAARNRISQPYRDVAALSENGGYTLYHDPSSTGKQKFFTSDSAQVTPPGLSKGATAQVNPENPLVVAEHPTQAEITQAFKDGHDAIVIGDAKAPDAVITPSDKSPNIILEGSPRANAAANLEAYRQAKADAKAIFQNRNASPAELKTAHALDDKADSLLTNMEQAAMDAQKPDLIPALQEAKVKLAQNHDIDRALGGRESIDPAVFGRDAKRNGILGKSGDVKLMAQFALDHPDASKIPVNSSGVNKLSAMLTGLGALGGFAEHGAPGAVLAGAAGYVAPPVARATVLSGPYQRAVARYPVPSVDPPTQSELLTFIRQFSNATAQRGSK